MSIAHAHPEHLDDRDLDTYEEPLDPEDARALDLACASRAAQLVGQFEALRQAGRAQRVAFREQPAGRVGDDLAAIGVVAVGDELLGATFGAQPERLVGNQFVMGEAVVQLDDVDVIRPDAGIWWKIVEQYKVSVMFSSPTAARVLKKQDPVYLSKYDLSTLRHVFLAGEPLDEPTHRWLTDALQKPVIDHYWQTETGWPILSAVHGVEKTPIKMGTPSFPVYGYNLQILRESDATEAAVDEKGVVAIVPPLPPGCMSTVWGDDERFKKQYWSELPGYYFAGDGARFDEDGYLWVVGRIDDVLNVSGHRIGTAEVESALVSHPAVAEAAVVGRADDLKGQALVCFVTLKNGFIASTELKETLRGHVAKEIGSLARPDDVRFAAGLPKTRSGKIMRRILKEIATGGAVKGDITTLEDFSVVAALQSEE
mgnify:CR=1 FL=1